MQELRDLAHQLLTDKAVAVVIGYEQGTAGVRPAFITEPAHSDRLIFDNRCVHNLASYLSPRRQHVARLGRKAVVVKGCDARAIAGMIRESQLTREQVVIIGVRCGGVGFDATRTAADPLTVDTVAPRCADCSSREPELADHKIKPLLPAPPVAMTRNQRIAAIDAMSMQDRWQYWQSELTRCVRCNACREVCPMCFCERCVADKTEPLWIESSAHARGNLAWQLTRVLHQAGRCVDCGECERACPAGIPLSLLAGKMAAVVRERFDYSVGCDPNVPTPIGTFKRDDAQEFIL